MSIHYVEPLSRGIARAKKSLFNPIDLRTWFAVGFTAFLAGLADVQLSGGFPNSGMRKAGDVRLEQFLYWPQKVWEWLGNHPGWAMLIVIGLFVFALIMILITWLSARGKFMFLDNVVHGKSGIVASWYEYRKEGNSFFWWNLFWAIITSAVTIAYVLYCFVSLQIVYESGGSRSALIVPAILAGLGFLAMSIVSAFIFVLLRDFVVQIMYRDRITGWEAIQKFLPLFFSHFLYFIGYGIFRFFVSLLIVIAVLIFGCITCCIGFLVLAIPYIKSVVLLPVLYSMRAFAVEFLEQFGPEYRIFPVPERNSPEMVPPIEPTLV